MNFSDPSGTQSAPRQAQGPVTLITIGRTAPGESLVVESKGLDDFAESDRTFEDPAAPAGSAKKSEPAKKKASAPRQLTAEELSAELDRIAEKLGVNLDRDVLADSQSESAASEAEQDSPTLLERSRRHTAGPGALTTAESAIRSRYLDVIKNNADEAVGQIDEIIEAVRTGALTEEQGLAQAEATARKVSEGRNAVRTAAQEKLGPGGRILSETIEGTPPSFESRVADKGGRNLKDVYLGTHVK